MPRLTLVRGLPGSGKSTLAKRMAKETGALHLEADMYFMKDGEYMFDAGKLKEAHAWCQEEARKGVQSGRNVIVSNTFIQKWQAQPYLDLGIEYGVPVEILVCKGTWKNVHNVPEETLKRLSESWEEF